MAFVHKNIRMISESKSTRGNEQRWKDCVKLMSGCGPAAVDFCHKTYNQDLIEKKPLNFPTHSVVMCGRILPSDLMQVILVHLAPNDLLSCARVSRGFYAAISPSNDRFWTAVFMRRYGELWRTKAERVSHLNPLPSDFSPEYCQQAIEGMAQDDQLVTDLRGRVAPPLRMQALFFGHWRFVEGHQYRQLYIRHQATVYPVRALPHQTWSALCVHFWRETGIKIERLAFAGVVMDPTRKVGSYSTLQRESTLLSLPSVQTTL